MHSTSLIYKATNLINGKIYVGFTSKGLEQRIKIHIKNSTRKKFKDDHHLFYNAIRKYGISCFEWTILYESWDDLHCLKVMEPYFIEEYQACGNRCRRARPCRQNE